jgi:hypothetical protein
LIIPIWKLNAWNFEIFVVFEEKCGGLVVDIIGEEEKERLILRNKMG